MKKVHKVLLLPYLVNKLIRMAVLITPVTLYSQKNPAPDTFKVSIQLEKSGVEMVSTGWVGQGNYHGSNQIRFTVNFDKEPNPIMLTYQITDDPVFPVFNHLFKAGSGESQVMALGWSSAPAMQSYSAWLIILESLPRLADALVITGDRLFPVVRYDSASTQIAVLAYSSGLGSCSSPEEHLGATTSQGMNLNLCRSSVTAAQAKVAEKWIRYENHAYAQPLDAKRKVKVLAIFKIGKNKAFELVR